ncbi:MAG: tRNA pseudouridine(13) synthase TruD, partial [Candidatus Norongarragalinales archaeon]
MVKFAFKPEEFVVEEIFPDGRVMEVDKPFVAEQGEGKFCHFVMQKRQWNTSQALNAIARALHTSHKRFNCAGTKDRNATTVQLCSAFSIAPQKLMAVNVKDIKVLGAWNAPEKVRMGELLGNRFTITLNKKNCGVKVNASQVEEKAEKLGYCIPNYFGEQRFGSLRLNTHLVGKLLLKGLYKEAVLNFLSYTDEREKGEGRKAREKLASEGDFAKALEYFPS